MRVRAKLGAIYERFDDSGNYLGPQTIRLGDRADNPVVLSSSASSEGEDFMAWMERVCISESWMYG